MDIFHRAEKIYHNVAQRYQNSLPPQVFNSLEQDFVPFLINNFWQLRLQAAEEALNKLQVLLLQAEKNETDRETEDQNDERQDNGAAASSTFLGELVIAVKDLGDFGWLQQAYHQFLKRVLDTSNWQSESLYPPPTFSSFSRQWQKLCHDFTRWLEDLAEGKLIADNPLTLRQEIISRTHEVLHAGEWFARAAALHAFGWLIECTNSHLSRLQRRVKVVDWYNGVIYTACSQEREEALAETLRYHHHRLQQALAKKNWAEAEVIVNQLTTELAEVKEEVLQGWPIDLYLRNMRAMVLAAEAETALQDDDPHSAGILYHRLFHLFNEPAAATLPPGWPGCNLMQVILTCLDTACRLHQDKRTDVAVQLELAPLNYLFNLINWVVQLNQPETQNPDKLRQKFWKQIPQEMRHVLFALFEYSREDETQPFLSQLPPLSPAATEELLALTRSCTTPADSRRWRSLLTSLVHHLPGCRSQKLEEGFFYFIQRRARSNIWRRLVTVWRKS